MHHYPRHIGDYYRKTGHLDLVEHGAYTRLLDLAYQTAEQRLLPANQDELCRLCVARSRPEKQAVKRVLSEFFKLDPPAPEKKSLGGYYHSRVDEEIGKMLRSAAQKEYAQFCRWGVAKGVFHKEHAPVFQEWFTNLSLYPPSSPESIRLYQGRLRSVIQSNNHDPVPKNHKPITTNRTGGGSGLDTGEAAPGSSAPPAPPGPEERIMQAYPRPANPMMILPLIGHALNQLMGEKGWTRDQAAGFLEERVRAHAAVIAQAPDGTHNRFVAGAESYFGAGRWREEPETLRLRLCDRGPTVAEKNKWGGGIPAQQPRPRTHPLLPEPPCDWRAILRELYPIEQYESADYTLPWGMYEPDQRKEIIAVAKARSLLPAEWKQTWPDPA